MTVTRPVLRPSVDDPPSKSVSDRDEASSGRAREAPVDGCPRESAQVPRQTIAISGSGDYRAGDLVTRNSTAELSGSGNVAINVRDVLKAEISGCGDVTYTGDPEVSQDISGSGELRKG